MPVFFFQHFNYVISFLLASTVYKDRSVIKDVFYMLSLFFKLILWLSLSIDSLTLYLVVIFEFILLRSSWSSWMCKLGFFSFFQIRFGKLLATISPDILTVTFYSPFLGSVIYMLICLIVTPKSLSLCLYFLDNFNRLKSKQKRY